MSAPSNAPADSAAVINLDIAPGTPWRVTSVEALDGYRLRVRFVDGLEGEVHMAPLLVSPAAGVFAPLRDMRLFNQVHLCWGAVTWPGELDLAPDAMHDDIKSNGVCRVDP